MLQRGTDWAFLRSLAAKWGYAVYLESTTAGVDRPLPPDRPARRPAGRAVARASAATRSACGASASSAGGQRVKAARIPALSDAAQDGRRDRRRPRRRARTRSAAQATCCSRRPTSTARSSRCAAATGIARDRRRSPLTLTSRSTPTRVGLLLRARRTVLVKGLGSTLSGRYLVERVRHTRHAERHRQQLTLVRNALGLTGDEPFGAASWLGGLAVIERFTGKYLGDRRRQRRPEGARAAAGAGARGASARRRPAGACRAARTRARASGSPRSRRSAAWSSSSGPPATRRRVPIWSGGTWADGEGGPRTPGRTRSCWSRPAGTKIELRDESGGRGGRDRGGVRRQDRARRERRADLVRQPEDRDDAARRSSRQRRRAGGDVMPGYLLDAGRNDHVPARRSGDGRTRDRRA